MLWQWGGECLKHTGFGQNDAQPITILKYRPNRSKCEITQKHTNVRKWVEFIDL